eukprot:GHVN01030739.1.p2 GENE.GHVN01030739.1~~GHVN01030739.1.p2  ORF type:complete len:149 (-),score=9.71 GHVN01030739.1:935-1381(-)
MVSYSHLVFKLRKCGVGGKVLEWITNWLSFRKQRVKVNNVLSEWYDVPSSVIQGSVLGPLLFIVYLSDLCMPLSSSPFQFVDNLKLIRAVRDGRDCRLLQNDLRKIEAWCNELHMKPNPSESSIMNVGSFPSPYLSIWVHFDVFIHVP